MGAHVQWLSELDGQIGVFRCGEEFDKWGDPYEMVCTVQMLPDGGLHMFGVQSTLKMQLLKHLADIRQILKADGVKYVLWEKRLKDGSQKSIKINL